MAHSISARKRIRQNVKRRLRNRRRTAALKGVLRGFLSALQTGKTEDAAKALPGVYKRLDQIAAKGTITRNTASRYKSRLTARLNKTQAGTKAA